METLSLEGVRISVRPDQLPPRDQLRLLTAALLRGDNVLIPLGNISVSQLNGVATIGSDSIQVALNNEERSLLAGWLEALATPITATALGGIPLDLRRLLLLQQSYPDLVQSCQLPEFRSLCYNDSFWAQKLGISEEVWRSVNIIPLTRRYLYFLTRMTESCERGSEEFVGANICLTRSIANRRPDLVEYFLPQANFSTLILEAAARVGDLALLRRIVPVNQFSRYIPTILDAAAEGGQRELIDTLLPQLPGNVRGGRQGALNSMLFEAATNNHRELVGDLIASGAVIDDTEEFENIKDPEIFLMLVPVINNADPQELLFEAGRLGSREAIQVVLDRYPQSNEYALLGLARGGHYNLFFEYLGANRPTQEMLENAAESGNLALVQQLVRQGLTVTDEVIHRAVLAGHPKVATYLVSLNPNLYTQALTYATQMSPNVLQELLQLPIPKDPGILSSILPEADNAASASLLIAAGAVPSIDIIRNVSRYGRPEVIKVLAANLPQDSASYY